MMTVLEVLQSTAIYFEKRQVESARLNAEHLVGQVLGLKRMALYLEFERVLTEAELAPLRDLVRRRGQGEPLQHLLGTVEFCGHTFACDKRALIPRPETEELVAAVIAECGMRKAGWRILDVGTGSGVIALSLAAKFPAAEVHALDISEAALSLARENAERLGLGARVRFTCGDLLAGVTESFDLIVANLPYVPTTDRESLSREVRHDPETALFGGESGEELVRKLITQAPACLQPDGVLALEIGIDQAERLTHFLKKNKFTEIQPRRDFGGVIRFLCARYG